MRFARTRFWTAFLALTAMWLAMMMWGGPDEMWDRRLFATIHTGADQAMIRWASLVTHLGGWIVLSIVGIAAVIALAFKRRRRAALLLVLLFGGRMAVELHKLLAGTPRPPIADEVPNAASLSFPSGHAANAMITYVSIALLVPVAQRNRTVAVALAGILAVIIGLSRVVLGVHWPSDVIGGWAFGLLLVVIFMRLASARPDAEAAEANREAERFPPLRHFPWRRRRSMTDDKDRGQERADSARRHDDGDIIDRAERAPGQGGTSGGNLQRDVASRDELDQTTGDGGVTRVRKSDKPDDGDEPTLPNRS